ncbi:phage tail tape measure protein [Nocardia sp. NPDC057227]|uniref:phage tail tape measure protein n=1 Tax=Nocardia sp. NPDC057227 TaxID=3346056 RepID=UPI003638B76E
MPTGSELAVGYVTATVATDQIPRQLAAAFGQAADRAQRDFTTAFGRVADVSGREFRQEFGRSSDAIARDLRRDLGRAGEQAGQGAGDAAGGGIADGLKGKAGMFGAVLGPALALAGVSAGGLFVAGLMRGMEREQTLDMTQARLGVDEATMQRIGSGAGQAYAGAFGESVEANIDVARQAIQGGLLDPGATSQEIAGVVANLQGLADLMGGDVTETAKAAGIMVKNGLAANAGEAFDLITGGYRAVGLAGDDLVDSIKEYSSGWKNLGITGTEAMALLAQSTDQLGADSTDRAADAMRELGRRVTEEGEDMVAAMDGIGLSGQEMYDALKGGGPGAFTAMDTIFDKIRGIQDPTERNAAAMALLGDTAGDFIDVFTQWDPSAAVEKFGTVTGAAQNALDTMGGNAASSIESAKRSIEVSADGISSALAGAFGPELAKVANWVSEHQPEILGFLGTVADGAFATGDAFLAFSSTSLDALALFAEGSATALGYVMDPLGQFAELFGKITGSGDIEDAGRAMRELDDGLLSAAAGASHLSDMIDQHARPKLEGLRANVADNVQGAVVGAEMFRALGDAVVSVPDGKTIHIDQNTPEVRDALADLGLTITELPNGEFIVTSNTAEGQQRLDQFVAANNGRPIELIPRISGRTFSGTVTVTPNALGGIVRAGDAAIQNRTINQWAEEGPEAYIPLSPGRRGRAVPIWLEAGRMLGMIDAHAAGGIVPGKQFAQSMDPAAYAMGGFSRSAIDCSAMAAATINDAMGREPFSERMTTMNAGSWLAARGAEPGLGGPGDIAAAWFDNGGGANGHIVLRLGDGTGVESRGGDGVVIGSDATPVTDPMFDHRMHLPRHLLLGGDAGATGGGAGPAAPSLGGSGGAGAPGGGAGGGALGGNAGGGSFGGQDVPAGVVPVWVIGPNGVVSQAPSTGAESPGPTAAPADSFAPQQQQTQPAQMPDIGARAAQAGGDFLNAQVDALLGDLGLRRSGGAAQAVVQTLMDAVAVQVDAGLKAYDARQRAGAAPWMR